MLWTVRWGQSLELEGDIDPEMTKSSQNRREHGPVETWRGPVALLLLLGALPIPPLPQGCRGIRDLRDCPS